MTSFSTTLSPLLSHTAHSCASHIARCEFAVFGPHAVMEDIAPIPAMKKQIAQTAALANKFGLFPFGEDELARFRRTWLDGLSEAAKLASLMEELKKNHGDLIEVAKAQTKNNYIELIEVSLELTLVELTRMTLERLKTTLIIEDIVEIALGKIAQHLSNAAQPANSLPIPKKHPTTSSLGLAKKAIPIITPWWWAPTLLRLKTLVFFSWIRILALLKNSPAVDEFVNKTIAAVTSTYGPVLAVATIVLANVVPTNRNMVDLQIPSLLIQIHANADDDGLKETVLYALQACLERAEMSHSPDTNRLVDKVHALADAAYKSKLLKEPSVALTCVVLCKTCATETVAGELDKFITKRILQPLTSSTDASKIMRAARLARLVLTSTSFSAFPIKKRLVGTLTKDVFEKLKTNRFVLSNKSDLTEHDFEFVRIIEAMALIDFGSAQKSIVALISEEESLKRMLIGIAALKRILSRNTVSGFESLAGRLVPSVLQALAESFFTPDAPLPVSTTGLSEAMVSSSMAIGAAAAAAQIANINAASNPSPENDFFSSLSASSSQSISASSPSSTTGSMQIQEFKARLWYQQEVFIKSFVDHNEFDVFLQIKTRVVEPLYLMDEPTLIKILCTMQGVQCVALLSIGVGLGGSSLFKMAPDLYPPVRLLDPRYPYFVREAVKESLTNIVSNPQVAIVHKIALVEHARDDVVKTMGVSAKEFIGLLENLNMCTTEDVVVPAHPPSSQLGDSLDALALALYTAGIKDGDDLAQVVDSLSLSLNQLVYAMQTEKNIVALALKASPATQQHLVKILLDWNARMPAANGGGGGHSNNGNSNLRVKSVIVALDPTKALFLERDCFETCLRTGDKSILDVVCGASQNVNSATHVVERTLAWWNARQVALANGQNTPAITTTSLPKKSLFRRLGPAAVASAASSVAISATATAPNTSYSSNSSSNSNPSSAPTGTSTSSNSADQAAVAATAADSSEDDEILIRVASRVLDDGRVLEASLAKMGATKSTLIKALRECLLHVVEAQSTKRKSVSEKSVLECLTILRILSTRVRAWCIGLGSTGETDHELFERLDVAWGRAERRKLWLWLRRISGFSERPISVNHYASPPTANRTSLQETLASAACALLSLGPVSLGSVADEPDRELWAWILHSANGIAEYYLSAHWSSLFPSYFRRLFPLASRSDSGSGPALLIPTTTLTSTSISRREFSVLIFAIVRALHSRFGLQFDRGVPATKCESDETNRMLLVATSLMCPNIAEFSQASSAALCVGLCMMPSECGPMAVSLVRFTRNGLALQEKEDDVNRTERMRLSRFAAKARPEMAEKLCPIFWERNQFEVSVPWAKETKGDFLFEKAWESCPGLVWSAFPDESASLRYLVDCIDRDEIRARQLLIFLVSSCTDFMAVLTILTRAIFDSTSPKKRRVCSEALSRRCNDLLDASFANEKLGFVEMASFASIGSHDEGAVELGMAMSRWMRMHSEQRVIGDDFVGAAIVGLLALNHTDTLVAWCDTILNELNTMVAEQDQNMVGMGGEFEEKRITTRRALDTYLKLRAHAQPSRFTVQEECALLANAGPVLCTMKDFASLSKHVDNTSLAIPISVAICLSYVTERWTSGLVVQTEEDQDTLFALEVFRKCRGFNGAGLVNKAFWVGFERLIRIALRCKVKKLSDVFALGGSQLSTNLPSPAMALYSALLELSRDDFCGVAAASVVNGESKATSASESKAMSTAMRLFNPNDKQNEDCGEDALLILFDVGKETESGETPLMRAFCSKSAGVALARRVLDHVLTNPPVGYWYSRTFVEAAASLVEKMGVALTTRSVSFASKYVGVQDDDVAMEAAKKAWKDTFHDFLRQHPPPDAYVTIRKPRQEIELNRKRLLDESSLSFFDSRLSAANVSDISRGGLSSSMAEVSIMDESKRSPPSSGGGPAEKKRPPPIKPVNTMKEAIDRPDTRMALLAHAEDLGIDPSWLRFWGKSLEECPFASAAESEIAKEELFESFQRSRWWVEEDEEQQAGEVEF